MKKIILLLSILLLTGCGMQKSTSLIINDDQSIDVVIVESYDNELIDNAMNQKNNTNKTYSDEERWKFIEENYGYLNERDDITFEKYEDGNYKGYKINIKINNINDITGDETNFNLDDDYDILNYKIFKKDEDKYVANIDYSGIDINEEMDYNIKFNVTLPVEPISHNATSVSEDKKTLTWNLVTSDDGKINFEFSFLGDGVKKEKDSNSMLIVGIIGGTIALILIIVFVILFLRKKKLESTL